VTATRVLRSAGYRIAWTLLRGWWIVHRPRSEGVRCIVGSGEKIVLVRHSYGDRAWMLPGGRVRRAEDPRTTAAREIEQELGIRCESWRLLGSIGARQRYRRRSRSEAFRRHATHYLEAEAPATALHPRAGELCDAGWFPDTGLPSGRSDSLDVAASRGWLTSTARVGADGRRQR
jgi:8-oxo-dGTP pyrophosphatase MutT (NUDIX family)